MMQEIRELSDEILEIIKSKPTTNNSEQLKYLQIKTILDLNEIRSRSILNYKINSDSTTPLLCLASSNSTNFSLVKLLIERGADVNARNKSGQSALTLFIISYRPPPTYTIDDVNGHRVINQQRPHHHHQNTTDEQQNKVLTLLIDEMSKLAGVEGLVYEDSLLPAILYSNMFVVQMLVTNRRVKLVMTRSVGEENNGRRPLWEAARVHADGCVNGAVSYEIARFLIESGADVNERGRDGTTPLMLVNRFWFNEYI